MTGHRIDLTSGTAGNAVRPMVAEAWHISRTSPVRAAGVLTLAMLLLWSARSFADLAHSEAYSGPSVTALPAAAQGPISAVLGRDESRYWVHERSGRLYAENSRNALSTEFTRHGVKVSTHAARWVLALRGYGYGEALRPVSDATPRANTNRVEYARAALTEWYVNGPLGLEQGFTLAKRPGHAKGRPLTVALAMSGDLMATVDPDGTGLTLTQRDGEAALRFAGLTARDATGRELHGSLKLRDETLLLQVDDADAQYPLVVDPFVQQAKLTASDGSASSIFGDSVSITGDGHTVVVGAPREMVGSNHDQGEAYVFVEPAAGWAATSLETTKLTASDGAINDELGISVAISSDGNTVVAGAGGAALGGSSEHGAAYVFVKPASGWPASSTQAAKLTASDGAQFNFLGGSVATSGDGSVVVAGAPGLQSSRGALYVYVEPTTGWAGSATQTAELTASDAVSGSVLGWSVAVDVSGTTIVGGAVGASVGSINNAGAAYVFVGPPTGWATATQTTKLTASDAADGDGLGTSVSISANGNAVAAGAPNGFVGSNQFQGAAYVFLAPATGWAADTNQTSKLTASDGANGDLLGSSVAISGDGSTVAAGAPSNLGINPNNSFNPGAVYVFVEPTGGWTASATQTNKLIASDGVDGDEFGIAVAISGDGSGMVTGALGATVGSNFLQGAAYVFGPPPLTLACSATTAQVGLPYNSMMVATGGVLPEAFSITSGSLPAGLTLNSGTGAITGTPTMAGPVNFTAQVRDASGLATGIVASNCSITVNQVPTITSPSNATFAVGMFGSFTVSATGFPAPIFAATGLPSGLTLSPSGQLTGTPATGTAGNYSVVITAANGVLPNAVQNFKLTVTGPQLSVTPTAIDFGKVHRFSLRAKTISVTNIGTGPVSISSVSVTPDAGTNPIDFTPISFCGSSLAVGRHCTIIVILFAVDLGSLSAQLNIADNAAGSPQGVSLSATVTPIELPKYSYRGSAPAQPVAGLDAYQLNEARSGRK